MIDSELLKDIIGTRVYIRFVDHAMHDKTLCICEAIGELVDATKEHLVLRVWHTIDAPDNDEFISIILSAIKKLDVLKVAFVEFEDGSKKTNS